MHSRLRRSLAIGVVGYGSGHRRDARDDLLRAGQYSTLLAGAVCRFLAALTSAKLPVTSFQSATKSRTAMFEVKDGGQHGAFDFLGLTPCCLFMRLWRAPPHKWMRVCRGSKLDGVTDPTVRGSDWTSNVRGKNMARTKDRIVDQIGPVRF